VRFERINLKISTFDDQMGSRDDIDSLHALRQDNLGDFVRGLDGTFSFLEEWNYVAHSPSTLNSAFNFHLR
jgi:hypothetical protein